MTADRPPTLSKLARARLFGRALRPATSDLCHRVGLDELHISSAGGSTKRCLLRPLEPSPRFPASMLPPPFTQAGRKAALLLWTRCLQMIHRRAVAILDGRCAAPVGNAAARAASPCSPR